MISREKLENRHPSLINFSDSLDGHKMRMENCKIDQLIRSTNSGVFSWYSDYSAWEFVPSHIVYETQVDKVTLKKTIDKIFPEKKFLLFNLGANNILIKRKNQLLKELGLEEK